MSDLTTGPNAEQAEAWNAAEGAHYVEHHQRYDAILERMTPHMLDSAAIESADNVLDVGCGCGQTTRAAARAATDGMALGLDLSRPMLDVARRLAEEEQLTNVRFEQGDAQVYPFDASGHDVALSRFGVMFFADPKAGFANIGRALRPGGRLTFLCWQDALASEFIAVPAGAALVHLPAPDLGGDGPGPFSLADRERILEILEAAGFSNVGIEPVEEAMRIGDDPDDVVGFIRGTGLARGLLADADEATASRALDAVRDALVPYATPEGVMLGGAAWLVTARSLHRDGSPAR